MTQQASDPMSRVAALCRAGRCEDAIAAQEKEFAGRPGDAELSARIGICYSGVCRAHRMVSRALAVTYLKRALELWGPTAQAERTTAILDVLSGLLVDGGEMEEARVALEAEAALLQGARLRREWARVEYNLGNVCSDLAAGGGQQWWEEAVRHYGNALTVRTEREDPARFAATAQNLGTAYRAMHGARHEENLKRAIGWYSAAFRACFRAGLAKKRADLHNNLGNAFLELACLPGGEGKNARRALCHFERALRMRTKAARPCDYAVTQFNLGQSYLRLGGCSPAEQARRVAACFHEALDGFLMCGDAAGAELARKHLAQVETPAA